MKGWTMPRWWIGGLTIAMAVMFTLDMASTALMSETKRGRTRRNYLTRSKYCVNTLMCRAVYISAAKLLMVIQMAGMTRFAIIITACLPWFPQWIGCKQSAWRNRIHWRWVF